MPNDKSSIEKTSQFFYKRNNELFDYGIFWFVKYRIIQCIENQYMCYPLTNNKYIFYHG